ncbi:MAG: hypothetical protein Q7S79_03035 [bacterium]|nr:hypothetical protein [bacterium]
MLRRLVLSALVVVLSFVVLFISIYRATINRYEFSGPNNSASGTVFSTDVEYSLPYPGVEPDHPLWFFKAIRDKAFLFLTPDSYKRAQRTLLLADSRLVMARDLLSRGETTLAVSTAQKAEGYLEDSLAWGRDAGVRGYDVLGFYETLVKSSLVHREVLEKMMVGAPEEARPYLNRGVGKAIGVYEQATLSLKEKGRYLPESGLETSP